MKYLLLALLMIGTLLSCKKKTTDSTCEDKMCTADFRSLVIKFVDNKGAAAEVKDFSVVNQRTGAKVNANSGIVAYLPKGSYIIIDDGDTKNLSEAGDDLKITGTSIVTNQTKSAIVKVNGGKCACHIGKVSGPEQIAFD